MSRLASRTQQVPVTATPDFTTSAGLLRRSYILAPVLFSLILSAIVNLQLFQDGSSYLFELLVSHSAVRHQRLSVLLIQAPTILAREVLTKMEIDPTIKLQTLRLIFSFSYSLIPVISLGLCWLVVRKRNHGLFIWAVLIILFINLVNFSWVSELLIALQLSCSLLLAAILIPGSQVFWLLTIVLSPIVFLLHPLVVFLFLTIATGSAYVSYKNLEIRQAARSNAMFFLTAAVLRGMVNLYGLNPYEISFLESAKMHDYLFATSFENRIFLLTSLAIGLLCLSAKLSMNFQKVGAMLSPLIVTAPILAVILFLPDLNFLAGLSRFSIIIGCVGFVVLFQYYYCRHTASHIQLKAVYVSCMSLAVINGGLLLCQYFADSDKFPLKTGLTLFTAMIIMLMAAADSLREISRFECLQRFKLVTVLFIIFSFVVTVKAVIWHSAVQRLEQVLSMSVIPCTEVVSQDFAWLQQTPYNIINKWSLPSLALVVQDSYPRKLLLPENGCKPFYESGMVQIDPWTNIPQKFISPPLN